MSSSHFIMARVKWIVFVVLVVFISTLLLYSRGWNVTHKDIHDVSEQNRLRLSNSLGPDETPKDPLFAKVVQIQRIPPKESGRLCDKDDASKTFLIPTIDKLKDESDEDLLLLYWRYVNTLQVLCRNQMRHGVLTDGGKEVCIDEEFVPIKPCLVYSFGSALRFDFEAAIRRAYGCEIHTFDPSTKIDDSNRGNIPLFVSYHEIGLGGRDHVDRKGWTIRTLPSIIKQLGHENRVIDILKLDVEGGEWSGFQTLSHFKPLENVKQLLVELHFGLYNSQEYWGEIQTPYQLQVLKTLYDMGFRIFMREHTMSYVKRVNLKYGPELCSMNELSLINLKWKT